MLFLVDENLIEFIKIFLAYGKEMCVFKESVLYSINFQRSQGKYLVMLGVTFIKKISNIKLISIAWEVHNHTVCMKEW